MKRLFRKKKLLSKSFSEDSVVTINNTVIFRLLKRHGYSVKLKKRNLFGFGNAASCDLDDTTVCDEYSATNGESLIEFAITVDKIDKYHYKIKFKYNPEAQEFVEKTLLPQVVLKNRPHTNEVAIEHNDHLGYLMDNAIFKTNVFVVGNVHGCYYTMRSLLEQFPKDSTIIFIGDVCDYGNFTKDAIEFIIENNYSCIKGNHESYFLKSYDSPKSIWATDPKYGGAKTLQSYKDDPHTLHKHLNWIESLPSYIELNADNYAHFFISHGYGRPYYRRRNTSYADYALIHNHYLNDDFQWDYESLENNAITHIFGHDMVDDVLIVDHGKMQKDFGLNTGAPFGKKLSALELNTLKVYSQECDPRDIT